MKTFSKRPDETAYEHISCPVCGGSLFSKKWVLDEYAFSRCTGCGLLLQNPQPRSSELIQRYDEEYFAYERVNESQFFQLMLLGLRDVGFFSDVEPILESRGTDRSFLDIGCATGRSVSRRRHTPEMNGVWISASVLLKRRNWMRPLSTLSTRVI